ARLWLEVAFDVEDRGIGVRPSAERIPTDELLVERAAHLPAPLPHHRAAHGGLQRSACDVERLSEEGFAEVGVQRLRAAADVDSCRLQVSAELLRSGRRRCALSQCLELGACILVLAEDLAKRWSAKRLDGCECPIDWIHRTSGVSRLRLKAELLEDRRDEVVGFLLDLVVEARLGGEAVEQRHQRRAIRILQYLELPDRRGAIALCVPKADEEVSPLRDVVLEI